MAGTVIASDTITLSSVSDGYSVVLTPASCVIHADFDGSNPQLDYAYTNVAVLCGDEKVKCSISEMTGSVDGLSYRAAVVDDYNTKLQIKGIDSTILSGYIDLKISVPTVGLTLDARFSFTVERETTMLDWILDWNSNKTQIGDTYLITPKIFVGKKITGDHSSLSDVDGLTGVYIGPNSDDSCGIYGYKAGQDIFHIDEEGGYIGGWTINNNGIATSDGALSINSDGGIVTESDGVEHYHLYADGHATFANGKVVLGNDGSASFEGIITASGGSIANWTINKNILFTTQIGLNANNKSIAVANLSSIPVGAWAIAVDTQEVTWLSNHLDWVKQYGGVAMYYTSGSDYGFIAYYGTTKTFAAGSTNMIAGWSFDDSALWLGTKNNNYAKYTEEGGITIGTQGIRGSSWYLNSSDGTVSFVKGWVTFNADGGKIAGWSLDKDSLWLGTKNDTLHEFTSASGSLTFGATGIRGYKWYLDVDGQASFSGGNVLFYVDGAGYVAGGNLKWDKDGAVTGAGGNVAWTNDGAGYVAGGNLKWDKDGNITFASSVKTQWEQGIHIAQMMAFGQMLYRDPEFSLTADTVDFNGADYYPFSNNYDSWCIISAEDFLTSLNAYGIVLRGTFMYLHKIEVLDSSGTVVSTHNVYKKFTNSTETITILAAGIVTFNSGYQLKFYFEDNGGTLQIANIATDDNGDKAYTWSNLYGYDSNIYTSNNTPGKWNFVDDDTAPNSTKKALSITSYQFNSNSDHRLLGFYFANQSRANAQFVVKIIAKIPVGWKIENYYNQYGDSGKTTWVTSQSGTGDWFEYQCLVECGASGTFSTVNHFALVADTNAGYQDAGQDSNSLYLINNNTQTGTTMTSVEWRVAFATVWDATSSEKTWTTMDAHGIYTGTLRADQIVSGQINSSLINTDEILSNGNHWALLKDGSGYLADKNISWDSNGSLKVTGEITATSGSIGNWYIVDGVITSDKTGTATNYIKLDATNRKILLQSSNTSYSDDSYTYTTNSSFGAVISIDGYNGIIEARAKNRPTYSTATSYISSNGIFSNIAAINGMPASSGWTHYGAIVGLGFANVNKSTWAINSDETIVAGVYGRASNNGTAPAYGGFFLDLKAKGFSKGIYYFTDSANNHQLSLTDTVVIGLCNKGVKNTIYLPKNAHEGQEFEFMQMGAGVTVIDTNDGSHIYDDASENDYWELSVGQHAIVRKARWSIDNTTYDIWVIKQF